MDGWMDEWMDFTYPIPIIDLGCSYNGWHCNCLYTPLTPPTWQKEWTWLHNFSQTDHQKFKIITLREWRNTSWFNLRLLASGAPIRSILHILRMIIWKFATELTPLVRFNSKYKILKNKIIKITTKAMLIVNTWYFRPFISSLYIYIYYIYLYIYI